MTIDTDEKTKVAPGKPSRKRRMARKLGTKTATAEVPPPQQRRQPTTKTATIIALLQRKDGATLAEMMEATGWQPHSIRAVLTGLKKKGQVIEKSKRDNATCYRIVGGA